MPQEIPETNSPDVARMALAWAITLRGWINVEPPDSIEERQTQLTDQYNKVYNAILENERSKRE